MESKSNIQVIDLDWKIPGENPLNQSKKIDRMCCRIE